MMPHNTHEIVLQTNDDKKVLRLSDFKKFEDGSGYSCKISVCSGDFSCDRPFYFDDSHFPDAIRALQQMDAGNLGEATIKGQWEDDFIKFTLDKIGHVVVVGQIFEHAELSQQLKFAFETDRTVLGPLIRGFLDLKNG